MSPAVSQVPCRTELSSLSDGTWFHAGGNLPLPPADVGSPAGSGWLGRRGFKRKSKSFGYSICSFKSSGLRLVCQKVAVIAGFLLLFGEAFPPLKALLRGLQQVFGFADASPIPLYWGVYGAKVRKVSGLQCFFLHYSYLRTLYPSKAINNIYHIYIL